MASLSYAFFCTTKCSSTRENGHKSDMPNNSSLRVNGGSTAVSQASKASPVLNSVASVIEDLTGEKSRQNIPTEKQTVDPFRQGLIVDGGVRYRQTVVIRSYEIGPDKTATLETILNLLQETALNHVWMSGLLGDGFGATHGMMRNDLIWVVTRMHVQVEKYPIWGEVLEIETWVAASGKNGMRRDWLIRSRLTGNVFARASSTWVMMNKQTRRLSKMPDEVKAEISPWFIERQAIEEDGTDKIIKLDDKAKYVNSGLKPRRTDLDMNNHVNNVKYVKWMLETIPDEFMENHELSSIILEYRRECSISDVVQSVCEPDEDLFSDNDDIDLVRGFSLAPEILEGRELSGYLNRWPTTYTHLLQIKGDDKNKEIVRGRTKWSKKIFTIPH